MWDVEMEVGKLLLLRMEEEEEEPAEFGIQLAKSTQTPTWTQSGFLNPGSYLIFNPPSNS